MTNEEIEQRLGRMIKLEAKATHEIVRLIQLAYERKIHLERGYPTIFDWLTKAFKYSEGAANRRIQAAKLIALVPEASRKLETGELNLSTITQAQTAIRREERRIGEELSLETKREIITTIEGKSMRETECFLAQAFPELPPPERLQKVNETHSSLQLAVDAEFLALMEQAKAIHSNKAAPETLETLKESLKAYITAATAKQSVMKRTLLKRAHNQCEFIDEKTGHRCTGERTLQNDHIHPKAKGGTNALPNRRMLCRSHNLLEAERHFGRAKIRQHARGLQTRTPNRPVASKTSGVGST